MLHVLDYVSMAVADRLFAHNTYVKFLSKKGYFKSYARVNRIAANNGIQYLDFCQDLAPNQTVNK